MLKAEQIFFDPSRLKKFMDQTKELALALQNNRMSRYKEGESIPEIDVALPARSFITAERAVMRVGHEYRSRHGGFQSNRYGFGRQHFWTVSRKNGHRVFSRDEIIKHAGQYQYRQEIEGHDNHQGNFFAFKDLS